MTIRLSTGLTNGLLGTSAFKTLLEDSTGFQIDLYTGVRPATPDAAATGTKLASIKVGSAKCHLDTAAAAGVILKSTSEAWAGTGIADGSVGYYRVITGTDDGLSLSTTAIRVDGTVATSGGDMNMTSTTIATGAPVVVPTAQFSITNL